ncbi:hypothetical protein SAMN05216328_108187 [Ensifer sp. YR511]|nr:hypothetical protein SAMN05216328_108187 [Ensifer sp. YR511]
MLSIKGFCTLACFAATAALLAGCASDTMKTYIGQPVESVIIDYGPPTNVLDLGWNERAYQAQDLNECRLRHIQRRNQGHPARNALRGVFDAGLCRGTGVLL